MNRIVVLDDIDLSDEAKRRLAAKGLVSVFSGVPADADEIVARARQAEVVLCSWTKIDATVFDQLPNLRLISLAATGTDDIDMAAASERGVVVCNVPSYAANAVAELTLALMLALTRKIPLASNFVRRTESMDWRPFRGLELRGKTLGIVGTGDIGRRLAHLGRALEMSLFGYDLLPSEILVQETQIEYTTLERVFAESDIVTLHVPLMHGTQNLVNRDLLRLMPRTSILVNTARAHLVQQEDLYEALSSGRLAGAALDDVDLTCASGHALLTLENVVITPHIGFNTREAVANLTAICVDNAVRFLDGAPTNVVNPGSN